MAVIFSSVLADIAAALATCLVVAYFYFSHVYSYWKKRGVHYIRPTWFVGNLGRVAFHKEHLGEYLKKVYDDNPDETVIGLFAAKRPLLMARSQDVLRRVLVKDAHAFLNRSNNRSTKGDPLFTRSLFALQGKKWRHMRIKLTPTFTSGKIKNMFHLVNQCGEALVHCLDKEISKGGDIAVKDVVARYSTDVIASCAFGVDANALTDPTSEFRANTKKMFELSRFQEIVKVSTLFVPWLVKLLRLQTRDDGINDYIRRIFWEVADARRRDKIVRKDFVDTLMQLKDEGQVRVDDEKESEEIKQDSKYTNIGTTTSDKADIKLDSDDFVAQAFIFIAAGFETSSSVVSFTLYELALNNDIQDKLRREMVTVLNEHKSQVSYDAIAQMSYLEMVVSETLRKYPTVPVLERMCLVDYKIPDTDITVEQGTSIVIPVLAIHKDPAVYPEPEKFDPERFTTENKARRPNFTYLPFGEGPRICIGMRFGQMQVKTALVHILTSYKVKTCAKTPTTLKGIHPSSTVYVPINPIVLEFQKIKG